MVPHCQGDVIPVARPFGQAFAGGHRPAESVIDIQVINYPDQPIHARFAG
jgi:hypothetical protein